MTEPNASGLDTASVESELTRQQIQRLHELNITARWLVTLALWLVVAPFCLWNLRAEFALWQSYFTWTAVHYGLAYHLPATLGLALCVGSTLSVLLWQSRTIIWGISQHEHEKLRKQLFKIRQQGQSHPLWKRIYGSAADSS